MFSRSPSLDVILKRPQPSFWSLLIQNPYKVVAKWLYSKRASLLKAQTDGQDQAATPRQLTVVCISDTHNSQPEIPDGDLFVHAGDLTQGGTVNELQIALNWIDKLPHQHKIVIAGNHDMCLDPRLLQVEYLNWSSITYLQDTSVELIFRGGRKLSIYGTPHTRKHGSWGFQFKKGTDVFSNTVPEATDILVSHSPSRFHLDVDGFGDDNLLAEVRRVKPKLHVFGHVHEGYGLDILVWDKFQHCYEDICRGKQGLWSLATMVYILLTSRIWPQYFGKTTVAINPSAVGGLRDSIQHRPIVHHI